MINTATNSKSDIYETEVRDNIGQESVTKDFYSISYVSPFSRLGSSKELKNTSQSFGEPTFSANTQLSKIDTPPIEIEGLNNINAAVTSRIRTILSKFWPIVISKSLQYYFPIKRAKIMVSRDPEERRTIVLHLFVDSNASQALAFWSGLETDIQEWLTQLDPPNRKLFIQEISLRMHWK